MTVRAANRVVGRVALATVLLAIAGCGSSGDTPPPITDAGSMRGIIRYYAMATAKLGRPPEKMEELEAVLAGAVADPSPHFRSTRDGQEYVVIWGLNMPNLPPDTIVAYERTGVNGSRIAMQANGVAKEVTEEEFAQLKFPPNYEPGAN